MRSIFLIVSALVLVKARPDLTIGYDPNAPKDTYEGPLPDHDAFGLTAAGQQYQPTASSGFLTGYPAAVPITQSTGAGIQQDFSQSISTASTGAASATFSSGSSSSLFSHEQQAAESQLPPLITKSFYFESAPDEPEEEQKPRYVNIGRAQKNYKVIFIKAPTYGINSQIIPIVPPNEDKTIIYVLSKKPELNQNVELPPAPTTEATKPDVFFIKYKSEQEARDAQNKIQNVYETNTDNEADVGHLQSIANAAVPNVVSSQAGQRTSGTGNSIGLRGSFDAADGQEQSAVDAVAAAIGGNSEQTGFTVISGQPNDNTEQHMQVIGGQTAFTSQTVTAGDDQQSGLFASVANPVGGASSISVSYIGVEPEYLPPSDQN